MNKKSLLFLFVGLGICSATYLIDRFWFSIPEGVAIVLIILASISLLLCFYCLLKSRPKRS